MIGWISYIRICHKISSFENDWLNILIICHWISPFKNGCLDILIWEIVKGNSNVCRCYCSSLEPPDQTCLGFRILTTRCEECQNKRVFCLFSLYNRISISVILSKSLEQMWYIYLREECCFRHIFTLLELRQTFV